MSDKTKTIERNSFYVEGAAEDVAKKLARLIDCSNPDNTGTGVEKKLDISDVDPSNLANLGLNVEDICDIYTVNLLHRKRLASEILMMFAGPLAGARAIVIGYKNRPDQSEIIPVYLEGPISPDNMEKAGLNLIRE